MSMDISSENGEGRNQCREQIVSEYYADYVISYNGNAEELRTFFQGECLKILDMHLAVVSVRKEESDLMRALENLYYTLPKCYGLMDTSSMEASGIIRIQNQPVLKLRGSGILVGIIDTGIDYQNPLFRKADGTTRIKAIWDQGIQTGTVPAGVGYGSEYTEDRINQALQSENPLEIVPSEDTNGHGTFVAGIIAGNEDETNGFIGAAPDADILVVKLKQAKQYLKDFYFIEETEVYQETDLMLAVYYLQQQATERNQQISIYLGVGTNSGDHSGQGILNQYLDRICTSPGMLVSLPVGNEGNARHHFSGSVAGNDTYEVVEVNVGAEDPGFIMEIWGDVPNTYALGIESPYGEIVRRIPPGFQKQETYRFLFERTVVEVTYVLVEALSGKQLIYVRIQEPTEGIWRFRVYGSGSMENRFHVWLPIRNFVTDNTFFLRPDPAVTLTEPSTALGPIAATAYNHLTDSLYVEAGRGYTISNQIKPDLAAPGVEVYGPGLMRPDGSYGYVRKSGTSIAAAHVAGAAALMMEWVRIRRFTRMSGIQIKRYLIRGADRRPDQQYPNPLWGYGTLNLYGTFQGLQQTDP